MAMLNRKMKLLAAKPFPFNGVMLKVDEEFEPDTKEQGDLLKTIGLAKSKGNYLNRAVRPARTQVMTAGAMPSHEPPPNTPPASSPDA
jgi:hypothetical protein